MSSTGLYCSYCGQLNEAEAVFCSRCGARQKPETPEQASAPTQVVSSAPIEPGSSSGQTSGGYAVAYGTAPAYQQPVAFHGYGGFWIRVVAAIIDAILVNVVIQPLRIAFGAAYGLGGAASRAEMGAALPAVLAGSAAIGFFGLIVGWIYAAGMESSSYQATLGKMALGLKVTDLYGNRISFARATGRHFAKWISAIILMIGFIMVAFTERKQGLHDMLAGTLVQKK